jgi:site-specific recombinase XerD
MGRLDGLTPREALDRWLDQQRAEKSESSISAYYYRLKLFVEWCEAEGITEMSEVDGVLVDEYELHRRGNEVAPSTLHNEIKTLRRWLRYLGKLEVVDPGLYERIEIPGVPERKQSDDTRLDPDAATALLTHFRQSPDRATREHGLLELTWHTGARLGGIRALDCRDVELEEAYVRFVHRPDTGTALKNGLDGERVVGLTDAVVNVLQDYCENHRPDITDEHGRAPLFATRQGRPSTGSFREWMYHATQPCVHSPCPHGREIGTCEYRTYHKGSQCPSSRSPHQVRTGAITWMLNRGLPPTVVSDRVNATPDVIKRHYDKQKAVSEMEERRREYLDDLELEE